MSRLVLKDLTADVFIETGTYLGESLDIAINSNKFKKYCSIDCCDKYFENAKVKYRDNLDVHLYKGNSVEILKDICDKVKNQKCLFWLDAHYQGGSKDEMVQGYGECPLISELIVITNMMKEKPIILIDDAKMFFDYYWLDVNSNHELFNKDEWPAFDNIYARLHSFNIEIDHDIIYAT